MKKFLRPFKNKYLLSITLFGVYVLFLDDIDIFTIITQNRKLTELQQNQVKTQKKLEDTKAILKKLQYTNGIEEYAREKKFFKRDNEDIFVISKE